MNVFSEYLLLSNCTTFNCKQLAQYAIYQLNADSQVDALRQLSFNLQTTAINLQPAAIGHCNQFLDAAI